MAKLIIIPLFLTFLQTSFSQVNRNTPEWYIKSYIHSHHSTGLPSPEWDIQFQKVKPDAVQFHAQAYSAGKELAERYNFAMVTTFSRSGGWKDILSLVQALSPEEQKEIYKRVNPDGTPTGRYRDGSIWEHACYHSPGIYRHITPEYKKLTEKFHPDQIWIDHTVITVNLCYCGNCRKEFHVLYGQKPPVLAGDPLWDEWIRFHRNGFEHWMKDVHDLVQSADEKTLVTFNHAYFLAQPEIPPSYVRNLSADIHSQLMHNCLFARYASTTGVPFDLMPGLTERWAGTKPKSPDEVRQTAAIITANGGRWNIGEFPMSPENQPADEMLELAADGAGFIRERQAWTHLTEAVPLVAILQSASTQYSRVIPVPQYLPSSGGEYVVSDNGMTVYMAKDNPGYSRIYWFNNRAIPDEIYGAGAALLENNIPFDIINEETLKQNLDKYKLLIVGDQFRLDEETVKAIHRFVKRGGGLIATGRTIESDLQKVLGVKKLSPEPLKESILQHGSTGIPVQSAIRISVGKAKVLKHYAGKDSSPAVTKISAGKGQALYVAGDFFKTYMDVSPYTPWVKPRAGNKEMRTAVAEWIKEITPGLGYSCSAPPWTEVALREKDGQLLIHFIERTFEWRNDLYKINDPIELSMNLKGKPEKVLLQPGNREVNWEWKNDSFNVSIPVEEILTHSILQVFGELK